MELVTGLFTIENAFKATKQLESAGISESEISIVSSGTTLPDFIDKDEEEAVAAGALFGALSGGTIGAIGTAVVSTIPGFGPAVVTGLLATTAGTVIGGYLGGLYSARAEDLPMAEIQKELAAGKVLLVVRTEDPKRAVQLLEEGQGEYVEIHEIPEDQEIETAAPGVPTDTINTDDPVDEAGWESFPASDPPPY